LAISKDAGAPTSKIYTAGAAGAELNKIKLEASNANLTLKKITLQLATASSTVWSTTSSIAADFKKVYLYDGTSPLNTGGTDVVNGDVVIAGLNLTLTQDVPKVLTVKADINDSGYLTSKSVGGIQVKSTSTTDMEVYGSQGLMSTGLTLTSNALSNYFLFHDSAPSIVNALTASGTKTPTTNDVIGKFTITNNGQRTMTITTSTITASLGGQTNTSSTVSSFVLYDESDTQLATASGYISATNTSDTFAFALSSSNEISAGDSKTYTIKANTTNIRTGTLTSGVAPILQTKIDGSKGYLSTDVDGPDELYWNDGNVVYTYTPVGGTAQAGNQASDSVPVDGPSLQY